MSCKKCKKDYKIVNKYYGLCLGCNNERLHGSKYGKSYDSVKRSRKSNTGASSNARRKERIGADESFYETCFNMSNHKCEECNKNLPTEFRNEESKVIARWRYSHIVAKSIAPELRHDTLNINHLCIECHTKWDFGDKKSMQIYDENSKRFKRYLNP
jgi:hypothetical protein